jgi:bifunctional DNase/RNase
MLIEMKVASLTVDPFTNMPILILRDSSGQTLPVWIGVVEASAIATELESIQLDRPMTHDLMKTILGLCAIQIDRVEIHDLRNETFFATLFLIRPEGSRLAIDARPSDAIALAMRANAPIFVAKKVVDKARRLVVAAPPEIAPDVASMPASSKWKM